MPQGHTAKTLVTLWFVTAAQPRAVLEAEPRADRGFARKYLAQFNPRWPLTHIGDFDMTRSANPGEHEYYIGGYKGLSVVRMVVDDMPKLSDLPERYRHLVNAPDVYATAESAEGCDGAIAGEDSGYGAIAHWSGGTLKRAFAATRETVYEDTGLPESFEMPFWEGNAPATGIQLPFVPYLLMHAAIEHWLGFSLRESEVEVPVSAFAVDGRPEAKTEVRAEGLPLASRRRRTPDNVSLFSDEQGYDDYSAAVPKPKSGDEPSNKQLAKDVADAVGRGVVRGVKKLGGLAHVIGDEVRRRARNTDRPAKATKPPRTTEDKSSHHAREAWSKNSRS